MSFPMEWIGSQDKEIKSGVVTFKVEGRDFSIPLPAFSDAMQISKMLDLSFRQGKDFAFGIIRSGISSEFDRLDVSHQLTLPPFKPTGVTK